MQVATDKAVYAVPSDAAGVPTGVFQGTVGHVGEGAPRRVVVLADAGVTWKQIPGEFPASMKKNIDTSRVAFPAAGVAGAAVGQTLSPGRGDGADGSAFLAAPQEIRMLGVNPTAPLGANRRGPRARGEGDKLSAFSAWGVQKYFELGILQCSYTVGPFWPASGGTVPAVFAVVAKRRPVAGFSLPPAGGDEVKRGGRSELGDG